MVTFELQAHGVATVDTSQDPPVVTKLVFHKIVIDTMTMRPSWTMKKLEEALTYYAVGQLDPDASKEKVELLKAVSKLKGAEVISTLRKDQKDYE